MLRSWRALSAALLSLCACYGVAVEAEVSQPVAASILPEMGVAGAVAAPRRDLMANLRVNNRVLCTVLGEPISVLDVQKHMEVQFYTMFPQYRTVPQAKWEFFQTQWRSALDELINQKLVLADAEERELDVADGDVREEMIRRFGVDLAVAMESMNLELNEAWEMIRLELKSQKMMGGMVYFPAFTSVTPDQVRDSYQQVLAKAEEERSCRYRILTVRSSKKDLAEATIEKAHQLFSDGNYSAQEVLAKLQEGDALPKGVTCQLSEEFSRPLPKIASGHREILEKLQVGAFSAPVQQQSRADQSTVQRIFLLTGRDEPTVAPFSEMAQKIQDRLTEEQASKFHHEYVSTLRERYGMTDRDLQRMVPSDLTPFEVR
ncbi:MAG: hypothetical protein ACOYKZ_02030 [Chlamydiia bacterium]